MFLQVLSSCLSTALFLSFLTFIGPYLRGCDYNYKCKMFLTNLSLNAIFQIPMQMPRYSFDYNLSQNQNVIWLIYIFTTAIICGMLTKKLFIKTKKVVY